MQKILLIGGVLMIVAGLAWPWLKNVTPGRLPGDFIIEKSGFKVFVPITTMIVISIVLTLILWFFRK
ncbi:MAG: DUF2905 domain-containing protein [Gammaproteobacteria bacterium]|nr:DUF2905 domain-containing protein [Gammaproteobacteria bacterium]